MRAAQCSLLFIFLLLFSIFSCSQKPAKPSLSEVSNKVQNLLELHTYEHVYRDVVYYGKEKSFLFFKTMDKRLLFSIDIRVRAGLDLKKEFEIIPDGTEANILYVKLPDPEILLIDADERSINQYFVKEYGGKISRLEFSDQIDEVKEQILNHAIEHGILEKAKKNAETVIRSFLRLSGFTVEEFLYPGREGEEEPIIGSANCSGDSPV